MEALKGVDGNGRETETRKGKGRRKHIKGVNRKGEKWETHKKRRGWEWRRNKMGKVKKGA